MSMNGEYLQVTSDELARAVEDPQWAMELAESIQEAEEQAALSPEQARYLTTHKAWQAIAFLLDRAQFPVDIVYGEEAFAEDEDWGYGPPRYLTAERVHVAAQALAATTYDELVRDVAPNDLAQARIYPDMWDEPDSLEWVRQWYEPLVPFFAAAASRTNGMLVWLD